MNPSAPELQPPLPSNRRFGFLFSGVSGVAAVYGAIKGWSVPAQATAMVAAAGFGLMALAAPAILEPLNRLWFKLGIAMGRIVSPIVMGVIFFALLTPVAILTRIAGRDVLRLRKRAEPSHWVDRDPPGPAGDSFKNMF